MTEKAKFFTVFFIVALGYVVSSIYLHKERDVFLQSRFVDYVVPSALIGPLSLEFKGLASDALLFKFMTFIGGRLMDASVSNSGAVTFDDQVFAYIKKALVTITDLDPYYWDAYLFSQMYLTWEAREYAEANTLLLKARKYRPDDYRPPYYIGFNYYYFLKDNKNAAKYFMEASKIPGSPYYLASLAARLYAYSSEHRVAIVFLKEMLKETRNERAIEQFKTRIQTLEILDRLEYACKLYENKLGKRPRTLDQLVIAGFIKEIPKDPYGGQFFLRDDGSVYTTSNMLKVKGK